MTPAVPPRVVGMVQDITRQTEAQAALERSEQEQRTLIATLPDLILRLNCQGQHLFVSKNISSLVPWTAAQALGRTQRELGFPEALCCKWDAVIAAVFESGQAQEFECAYDGDAGGRTLGCRVVRRQGQRRSCKPRQEPLPGEHEP